MTNQSENPNNNTGFQALRQDDTGQWQVWMPAAIQAVLPERVYFVKHKIVGKNELAVYKPERWRDLYWELNDAEHVHDGFARYVKTNRHKLEMGDSSSTLQKFSVPGWFVRFLDGDLEDIVWGQKDGMVYLCEEDICCMKAECPKCWGGAPVVICCVQPTHRWKKRRTADGLSVPQMIRGQIFGVNLNFFGR